MCLFYSAVFLLVFPLEIQLIAFLAGEFASHQLVLAKSLKIRAIPIFFDTGFDSGVIFVILYSFLMLILCDQLLTLITTLHHCFLSKENLPMASYWAFCPCFLLFFSPALVVCSASCACSTFLLKKVTPYRNFFKNLNFKNIVNFFKRTCCKAGTVRKVLEFSETREITMEFHKIHYCH